LNDCSGAGGICDSFTRRRSSRGSPPADIARHQRRGFGLIVGIFIALLLVSLAASWATSEMVVNTRACAAAEGRCSKATCGTTVTLWLPSQALVRQAA
jgi:hypothetical protein